VLGVGGTSAHDVYMVGGDLGVGNTGAFVAHFDGDRWAEIATGRSETLWWVWARKRDDVWLVGDRGLIMRWNGRELRTLPAITEATLFGAWGSSAEDVWFVGGKPGTGVGENNDVLLHWDGTSLSREGSLPRKGAVLFKVWGSSQSDVWISGEQGSLYHHGLRGWEDRSSDVMTQASPFSLSGCSSSEVYAVGGQQVFMFDGQRWRTGDVEVPSMAIGVACGVGSLLVVGTDGLKLRYDKETMEWHDDQVMEPFDEALHAGWIAPDGSYWAVGGNFLIRSASKRTGVVAYRGCRPPPASIETTIDAR
jgi:hypothetical protein